MTNISGVCACVYGLAARMHAYDNAPFKLYTKWRGSGYGVKSKIFPLCLKGRFYAIIAFRPKGKILRQSHRSVYT